MKQNNRWVDYKALKQQVSINKILEHYGLLAGMQQKKDGLVGLCPFHKESKPSLHVSLTKNVFHCFGCHAKGNILDFVQRKESVDLIEAGLLIRQWFGLDKNDSVAPQVNGHPKEKVHDESLAEKEGNFPLTFALKLDQESPYFEQRGLARETVTYFGLGYCTRGLLKGRVAIPIHDQAGELVAYAGRWPGEPPEGEAKYKLPPGFKKQLVLFNYHRAVQEMQKGELILVEGFFDCFRVWQSGYKNVVALMGTVLSTEQEAMLISRAKAITLMLDQDEAGRRATETILSRLARKRFVRMIELPSEGDQPDTLGNEVLTSLLSE